LFLLDKFLFKRCGQFKYPEAFPGFFALIQ